MNQYKYSTKQQNGSLKGIDLNEQKLNGQMQKDNEQNQSNVRQNENEQIKRIKKQEIEGQLMKFDEESHTDISDYEKETQITQTQNVEDHIKLNIDRTTQNYQDIKNKNQITLHQAFQQEIQSIESHKQKYPLNTHQKQKSQQYDDVISEQKQNFSINNPRSFNIFGDQKTMNKQILNERIDKNTLSSLKDIYQSKNSFEENYISSFRNRGTLTHFEDKQIVKEQNSSRSPIRQSDQYKQMKQQNNINEQNKTDFQAQDSFKYKLVQQERDKNRNIQQDPIKLSKSPTKQQLQDAICLNQKLINEQIPQNKISTVYNIYNSQEQQKIDNNNQIIQISTSNTSASTQYDKLQINSSKIQSIQTQKQQLNNQQKERHSDLVYKNINTEQFVPNNQNSNFSLLNNQLQLGRTVSDIQPQKEKNYNLYQRKQIRQQSTMSYSNQQNQQNIIFNQNLKNEDDENIKYFQEKNENNFKNMKQNQKNGQHISEYEDDQIDFDIAEHLVNGEEAHSGIKKNIRMKDQKKDHLLQSYLSVNNNESKNLNQMNLKNEFNPLKNRFYSEKLDSQNHSSINKPFQILNKKVQRQKNPIEKNEMVQANNQQVSSEASEIHLLQLSQDSQEEQQQKQEIYHSKFSSQSYSKSPKKVSQLLEVNYNKIAIELQRDLSGCKQKLQQIEKIHIHDQTFNENSFSDDSPESHTKIQEQLKNDLSQGQKFKTQILSDYYIQDNDQNQYNLKNNMQNKEENQQINQYTIKVKKCTTFNKSNPYQNEDDYNSPIQQEGNIHQNFGQISHSNENNLIIFSKDFDGSDSQFQSSHQIDDYNNFIVPQNSQNSQDHKVVEYSDLDVKQDKNCIDYDDYNHQISNDNNNEYKPKYEVPLSKLTIDKVATNIIKFDTEDDLDKPILSCDDEINVKKEESEEQQQIDQQQLSQQGELGIVTQFQINIPFKQCRAQRLKFFSQNNTPIKNQNHSNSAKASDNIHQSEKGIKKSNNRPSTFLSRFQHYKDQIEIKSSEKEIQNKQSSQLIQQQSNQKNCIPIFSIPQQQEIESKQDGVINLNDSVRDEEHISDKPQDETKQISNLQLLEIDNNLSGEDEDDIDYEEDEDEDEYDLDDEVDEIEGDIQIIQNIQRRASSKNQDEQNVHSHQKNQFKEQCKYNQREIGIGKYFCEKLFNVFGDNKLFQKKKRRLKKWRKMIQFAEDRLLIKSQNRENFEYSPIENKSALNVNQLVLPQLAQGVQSSSSSPIMNDFILSQHDSDQQYINQSPMKLEKQQSTYSERIKKYQQKLLEPNKQNSKGAEGESGQDNDEEIILNSQEEFELLYYFKKIKRNDFLKALKKGPPMWYRWSAWKVAIDLNIEEYQQLFENVRPKNSQIDNSQPILNPIDKQIDKDITRTFPNEPFFSELNYASQSLESLRCVLKAVSTHFSHVGYCQGMNFFAAYILLINGGDELSTFSMFIQMEKSFNIMSLFEEGFPLIQFMNFIFQREFGRRFQKLCRHFNQQKIPETMWVVQWFQTLFLNSLSLNVVCRFWDYIFCTGNILSLISISLSLLKEFNSHLININLETFSEFTQKLKSCQVVKGEMRNSPCKPKSFKLLLQKEQSVQEDNVIIDPDKIIKRAQIYEIPKREILSYIHEFKQVNCLYKDRPFLQKMEDEITSSNSDPIQSKSQNPPKPTRQGSQVKSSQSQQNTPKKSNKDLNSFESQTLLNPNSNDKKKSSFSLFSSFYDKKQQKEM